MGNQFSRREIENDILMGQTDFMMWSDGWKCIHCNTQVEWNVKEAEDHYHKKHALISLDNYA